MAVETLSRRDYKLCAEDDQWKIANALLFDFDQVEHSGGQILSQAWIFCEMIERDDNIVFPT